MQEFIKKVSKVQSELKAPKNQFNRFGNYAYRNAEDILESVKPLLSREGLVLTISDDIVQVGDRYYVKATATLTDGVNMLTNSALARESESEKGMQASQLTGSTSSYARKYALNGLLCIDDTKDADDLNKHGKDTSTTPAPKKKELTAEEKAAEIKKKVDEMVNRISKADKIVVGSSEYETFVSFAQKIDALGYKFDANRLIEALEGKSFKDELPRFE